MRPRQVSWSLDELEDDSVARHAVPRHRWFLPCAAALLAGAMSGCSLPREAEYPSGVRFTGRRTGTNFETVAWARNPKNPQPCPLVLHLPGGDLSAKELADPKVLLARGWATKEPDHGLRELSYRRGNLVAWAAHRGAILEMVGVNALTCPEQQQGIVSIGGKRLPLPVSEDEMIGALGQPIRRR